MNRFGHYSKKLKVKRLKLCPLRKGNYFLFFMKYAFSLILYSRITKFKTNRIINIHT